MTNLERIRTMIAEELKLWDQPSIAVGIVKDGEVVLREGFGFANAEKNLPAGPDTMYQIGSSSKAFTAAAAALLVDRGLLDWDRPVVEYLPWLRFQDDFTTLNATVRDMLCHRTGLPRHDAYWINGPCTRREMAENLRNMQPAWSFRSMWCYQNTCYVTVGLLIEALSGMSWEEFVRKELLEPLGMDRTTFYVDAISADPDHADPYARDLPTDLHGWKRIDFLKSDREDMAAGIGAPYGPAGSIMSTVNDMLKWLQFNLDEGKVGETQLISEANMKEIHKPQMLMAQPLLVPFPEQDFYSYAMGWFTETHRGHLMVEHGGNIDGFSALVTMIPDQKLGIVTLTNFNNSFDTYSTTYEIVDAYLGVEDGDWNKRWRELIAQVMEAQVSQMAEMNGEPAAGTSPSHPLESYVGTYVNPTYGELVISLEGERLGFLYNKDFSPLAHFHYDSFRIDNPRALLSDMLLKFETDKRGTVGSVAIGITLNPLCADEVFVKKVE
ncbi:MAG: serine hydrolase [Oscillospiraceae bacterium]|nr:serine hydrolase [Oscillospiraceae bacterium]